MAWWVGQWYEEEDQSGRGPLASWPDQSHNSEPGGKAR